MNSSDGRGASSHFRGRYSPSEQQSPLSTPVPTAPAAVEPPASADRTPFTPSISADSPIQLTSPPDVVADVSPQATGAAADSRHPSQPIPIAALLAGAGVVAALAALALVISQRNSSGVGPASGAPLVWQASCGSPPVSGSSWWPVLGPGQALDTVRSRYCGDAYLTAEGASQVASFSSRDEAAAFAERLSRESGYGFRVGQPRTP